MHQDPSSQRTVAEMGTGMGAQPMKRDLTEEESQAERESAYLREWGSLLREKLDSLNISIAAHESALDSLRMHREMVVRGLSILDEPNINAVAGGTRG